MQPLTKTFKVLNADKNIEELMATAARRTAENRGWATDIVIFERRVIETIHKQRLPTGERVC